MSDGVRVDKQGCLASGRCVSAAPDAFGWDEDGLADVRAGAASLSREQLVAIARNCPSLSIAILDERGNEIAP